MDAGTGSLLHRGSLDQGKNIEYLMIDGFGTYYFVHCIGESIPTGYILKGLSCSYAPHCDDSNDVSISSV